MVAFLPELFDGIYGGSKAYVLNFSRNLAATLRDKGVTVQAVLPGLTRTEILDDSGLDFADFPAEQVMEAADLVAAALAGLDRGEAVTIPPLHDERQWEAFEAARAALEPNLSHRDPAPRYREPRPRLNHAKGPPRRSAAALRFDKARKSDVVAQRALHLAGELLALALQHLGGAFVAGFGVAAVLLGLSDGLVHIAFDLVGQFTHDRLLACG